MTRSARTSTFDFTGSVVLVTGGGSGIGRAVATAFLEAGATVAVTGRRRNNLEETVAGHPPERTAALQCDASDAAQVDAAVAELLSRFGRLDVVVSNAGGYHHGPLTDMSDEAWAALRGTNVDGFFHLAKATLPHLVDSGGNLVAVSSISGERGDWGQSAYNATKAAVSNFVRSLALDYGERGVRVNAVAPAFTRSDINAEVGDTEEELAPFVDRIALGRPGEVEDIAPTVLFLASDGADYVTGVVVPVDGGTSASSGLPHM